jgi:hypothetical protein
VTTGSGHVSVEAISENALAIRQSLRLPLLLSALRQKGVLSHEQLERLADPHYSDIERSGSLLQFVTKHTQRGVDAFVDSLRETRCEEHDRILELLDDVTSEGPVRSPLLDIFDTKRREIVSRLSFTTFINHLMEMEELTMHERMEVYNPHRSSEENCLALLSMLAQRPGAQGLLKFIECLYQDPNPSHMDLASILLQEAAVAVKEHPRRMDIPQGDKTQLLQLERWKEVGTPTDVGFKTIFRKHEATLARELNVGAILPYLLKKKVLVAEEEREINQLAPDKQAPRLVAMVGRKGIRTIAAFVECLKQSKENERLSHLFDVGPNRRMPPKSSTEKTSKLAVLVSMDTFLWLKNDYVAEEKHMRTYNKDFEDHREGLQRCLYRLDFQVVDFGETVSERSRSRDTSGKSPSINTLFDKEVASRCNKDAVVFIFISGQQFPLKILGKDGSEDKYNGAVLTDGASILSRRKSDCIDMTDLKYWVELLPTDYITFLVDCHQSHVVSFGKQRLPSEVEIMSSPWSALTGCHGVVLYFCQPDPEAMWRLRGTFREDYSVFGKLTRLFVKVLISWISRRRAHNHEISHRLFYEAISFHWHKNGREHELFVPAIQGDVDRSFLGIASYPYLQVLRADLVRNQIQTSDDLCPFDLTKLQVATGTHLGLIGDDELEVFHILYPEVKVTGRVTRAHPLSSVAEIKEEGRETFGRLLASIETEEGMKEDGSTEFVMVKKKFPAHLRESYAVICSSEVPDSDRETIKNYIRNYSQLLYYALRPNIARLEVKKTGQFFTVEDREKKKEGDNLVLVNDIPFRAPVKTIQNVKSVLEIMAWFKHVKNLRSQTDLNHFLCYLVCERPLLTKSSASTDEHTLKASSQTGPHPPSEAILHFSDQPKFWCPTKDDHTPTLEVEFRENRVVTAVELRGDPDGGGHIEHAQINYKKLAFAEDCTAPSPKGLKKIVIEKGGAWYVTITPLEWDKGAEFCVAMRILVSIPQERGKPKTDGLSSMSVMHWNYIYKSAGWTITPEPVVDQRNGYGMLNLSRLDNMLRWSGRGSQALTFDLGDEQHVDAIEIACVPGTKPIQRFRVQLTTKWLSQGLNSFSTPWPTRHDLSPPLVVSNLQLCPPHTDFRAQIQLYGNTHEKSVFAEEGDILQLHFVNYTKQIQFVYLFYLEETGKIEIVFADVVQAKSGLKKTDKSLHTRRI